MGLRIGDGATDGHVGGIGALNSVHGGPDGGLGRPIEVPHRFAPGQQFIGKFGGKSFSPTKNPEMSVSFPSRVN